MTSRVVVLGAGHAGVEAAASLRKAGFDGAVTLVGEEDALPYQRPPLSKDYLAGTQDSPLPLRGEGFYAGQDVELRTGERVTAIDRTARRLILRDGPPIGYDHLILALGARPAPCRSSTQASTGCATCGPYTTATNYAAGWLPAPRWS
ncbi:FAD-dependent oxidoreductase [Phytohabitans flavus]|uniref:FAD-dependent oxidoreductase n=1 Tax=Phytohabitans flavus TaxID=1076124 RepID=UPI003624C478